LEQGSLYGRTLIGHLIPRERAVNIDGPEDWRRAEALLSGDGRL
jgi:CMP-N-acetylneuraminic acid synthetase